MVGCTACMHRGTKPTMPTRHIQYRVPTATRMVLAVLYCGTLFHTLGECVVYARELGMGKRNRERKRKRDGESALDENRGRVSSIP